MAKVSVVMGSDSDLPIMSACMQALDRFDISYEVLISSAHRLPEDTASFAKNAEERGVEVIIAGAGGAAHLAGAISALTPLPVIGVPLSGSALGGVDALYAVVQMPRGIPVATVAVDGAFNAGILAAQIIGTSDQNIRQRVKQYKEDLAQQVRKKNQKMQQIGFREYLDEKAK